MFRERYFDLASIECLLFRTLTIPVGFFFSAHIFFVHRHKDLGVLRRQGLLRNQQRRWRDEKRPEITPVVRVPSWSHHAAGSLGAAGGFTHAER